MYYIIEREETQTAPRNWLRWPKVRKLGYVAALKRESGCDKVSCNWVYLEETVEMLVVLQWYSAEQLVLPF